MYKKSNFIFLLISFICFISSQNLYAGGSKLLACGSNREGQLGDGLGFRISPVEILPGDIQAVSVSNTHTMILKTDGSLWACGRNNYGQLGNGTTVDQSTPVQIYSSGVKAVSAAGTLNYAHTLILKTDGSLWACGRNYYGQLGDGTTVDQSTPVQIYSNGVLSVATGDSHSLILKTDGSLWACGRNNYGQLGDGTTVDKPTPVQIYSSGIQAISTGQNYTMIIKTDGSLWACGCNLYGKLGDGTTVNKSTPVQIYSSGVQAASAGTSHTMILKSDGSLWACGSNRFGELGDETQTKTSTPVQVYPSGVQAVSAGNSFTMFLKIDGSLWACGSDSYGQLGDGTGGDKLTHISVPGFESEVNTVAAGSARTMILKTDGSLWACGDNSFGELGDGTTTKRNTPVQIFSSDVQAVSAGQSHTMILKNDGSLWACGVNSFGELGDGTTTKRNSPVQIYSNGVQTVATGSNHTMILKTDGSLWACGWNYLGQLGDGTTTNRMTPVEIFPNDVQAVSAGQSYTMILKTDGSLWACGKNEYGQLGDGTTINKSTPVQIYSNGVQAVATGSNHTMILKTDGSLWACGQNYSGQLGDGTMTNKLTSVQIYPIGVQSIFTGAEHTMILKVNGSLLAFGNNQYGQLGDGTTTHHSTPVEIFSYGVKSVALGNAHSLIIKGHLVKFIATANGSINGDIEQLVSVNENCSTVTANPNPGFHFQGWTGDYIGAENPLTITNVNNDMTITANFALNSIYNLTVVNGDGDGPLREGTATTITADPPATGFHFSNWTTADGGIIADANSSITTYTMSGNNVSITANYVANQLDISIDTEFISENGGTATGTITRNSGTNGDLTVNLAISDLSEAKVPVTVVIPDGSNNVNFAITAVNDSQKDGTQNITVTATAINNSFSMANISITDDDNPSYSISKNTLILDEDGISVTFDIRLDTQPPVADVVFNIFNSAPGDITLDKTILTFTNSNWNVPQTVTVIPIDDVVNGDTTVTLTVSVDDATSDNSFDNVTNQTVTVNMIDDDPTAEDDLGAVPCSATVVIQVLENDSDPQDDTLSVVAIIGAPAEGNATITDSGTTITYVADVNCGIFIIDYQISDGNGGIAEATVNIKVGEDVAYGLCFTIKANEVDSPLGGMLTEFVRRPRITAKYTDPIRNRAMKSNISALTRVPAKDGSTITEVECEWKRYITLYNKRALALANRSGTYTSTWLTNNPIKAIGCDINVLTYLQDRTKVDDVIEKKLILSAPEITDIEKWDATTLGTDPLQPSSIVVLKGKYFGCRPPTVWLEYKDVRNRVKKQRLIVLRIYKYDDKRGKSGKSCMDVNTGASEIRVQMPRRWWRGWTTGAYNLVIDNKVGLATTSVTTSDDAGNTIPTLTLDTFNIKTGERSYQLDVLDNDSDAHSDSVKIILAGRVTAQGGRIAYDRRTSKVKYTLPRGATTLSPFTDTFEYTLDDGHSDAATWPSNVTATINVVAP